MKRVFAVTLVSLVSLALLVGCGDGSEKRDVDSGTGSDASDSGPQPDLSLRTFSIEADGELSFVVGEEYPSQEFDFGWTLQNAAGADTTTAIMCDWKGYREMESSPFAEDSFEIDGVIGPGQSISFNRTVEAPIESGEAVQSGEFWLQCAGKREGKSNIDSNNSSTTSFE